MKQDKIKQIIVISESSAAQFEERMNESLAGLSNPEIKLYDNAPYTAVITYSVNRDVPENVIELLELIEGTTYSCEDCPHYLKSEDRRRRWGSCTRKCEKTRPDSRACEEFYLYRYSVLSGAREKYLSLPFRPE